MLTGSLLRFRRRAGALQPRLLDPAGAGARNDAAALLAVLGEGRGRRRGDLEAALEAAPAALERPVCQGLAKLLLDACTFATAGGADPRALRESLFDRAAEEWRRRGAEGLEAWRAEALAGVAAAHGLRPEAAERALFGDLPAEQVLAEAPRFTPEGLLHRYNVAQVQGLLLGADALVLRAPWPDPRRLRQLMRYLKFFGLLYRVGGGAAGGTGGLEIVVDGPLSVLEHSTRYGLQLAEFLPALLLWPAPWRLEAEVRPRRGGPGRLVVEPHPWLRSHYPDHGRWVPEAVARFAERFNRLGGPWRAEPAGTVLTLADNRCLVPDFELRDAAGAPAAWLEHVTHPAPETVAGRLSLAARVDGAPYLVASRATPAVRARVGEDPRWVGYRRHLVPRPVAERLEALRPSG